MNLKKGLLLAGMLMSWMPPDPIWGDNVETERQAIRQEIERIRSQLVVLENRLDVLEDIDTHEGSNTLPADEADASFSEEPGPSSGSWYSGEKYLPSRGRLWGTHFGDKETIRSSIHGFVDLEYIDAQSDGARSGTSTFDNHHVNIFIRSRLSRRLSSHVELEYEHSGEVVEIDQAFLDWDLSKGHTLRLGRFYTPFGIERFVWYSPSNSLVSRPLAMRQIVPGNFYANGIMMVGIQGDDSNRWTYEVSLSDGLGDAALDDRRGSRQVRDNNSSRALSGRIGYAFRHWLELGVSGHEQRYATDGDLDLRFLGVDLAARWKGLDLRAEYVDANLERDLSGFGDLEQTGWYAQLGYRLTWDRDVLSSVMFVTRRDDIDLDRSVVGNDDRQVWSFGVNLEVQRFLRLKLEVQFASEGGQEIDGDAFLGQVVFDF